MNLCELLHRPLFMPKDAIKCSYCGYYNMPNTERCLGFLCGANLRPTGGGFVEF